ncbi:MAG: rRNA maturation RNase YbeY [Bacteroidota bacterium]|nr:rRNA maturation RNase YbeY [Bacteroidota bacterium]
MDNKIQFFTEDVFFRLKGKIAIRQWLINAIKEEKKKPWYLNFIFCSDAYLLEINKTYLKRDTLTDIITFPYSDNLEIISGDIFISIERVKENSESFKQTFDTELKRIMIHGVLHLIGYDDKSKEDKKIMTEMEDHYLLKFNGK